jgi:hypothetical protein
VWKKVYKWLNVDIILFEEVWSHFIGFGAFVKYENYAKGHHLIWLAITWSLWNAHNNIIFGGEVANVYTIVDKIILISWLWFIGRIGKKLSFVFSDWCKDPLVCLQSS